MVTPVSKSNSQFRKLFQTKDSSDYYGAVWKVSPWKILFWMILFLGILIIIYSFFVQDQQSYLQDTLFYAILTTIVIIIAWVAGNIVWKARGFFVGFIIALILIFGFYFCMGLVLSFIGWNFHYGTTVWMTIVALAGIGAHRIDGKLDKQDLFYGLLVFCVLIFGNAPMFAEGMGLFAKIDGFIETAIDFLSKFISPGDLIAE